MKVYNLIFLILLFLVLGCEPISKNVITITNTLNLERIDELVRIPIQKINTHILDVGKKSILTIYDENNTSIPFQLEDENGDGQWDQLIFTTDFVPNEVKKIRYTVLENSKASIFPNATDIHFGVGDSNSTISEVNEYKRINDPRTASQKKFFQMEGPAWENDKVGFRMYFDPRNGIDIFGKTTPDLVLSHIGINGDYHSKEDWGMDILKVGNSLGAGSIAIKTKDSLYRITGKNGATFKILEQGPIKSSFEMKYINDTIQGVPIQAKHKISIYKGQWYYKSDISLSGITPDMNLVAGIVNLKPNTLHSTNVNNYFSLNSYGKQSENGDHLGMALLLNKKLYNTHKTITTQETGITNTHYVSFNSENDIPISFYFLAAWEASNSKFKTAKGFTKEVAQTLEKFSHPIIIE
ncbi:DUF4861 domain-containing protein [Aquimarina aggregata]|uniref:DUF4861 domain-containing protein n=1 Tax=Aquimarina aggregata TaxID=1642818 RepID=UPI0024923561|nr:DUF4861 domain-containing protein [Aquimarina aggregata]